MIRLWNILVGTLDWADGVLRHPWYPFCCWIVQRYICVTCKGKWLDCSCDIEDYVYVSVDNEEGD